MASAHSTAPLPAVQSDRRQPWLKFYPQDWRSDAELRQCSLAARGLWIEILAILHVARPYGHLVSPTGTPYTPRELARAVGATLGEVTRLTAELLKWGVASRTDDGTIYCRRMVREQRDRDADAERKRRERSDGQEPDRPPDNDPDRERTANGHTHGLSRARVIARAPAASDSASVSASASGHFGGRAREGGAAVRLPARATDPDFSGNAELSARAGRFIEDYTALYAKHRRGAHYRQRPALDYQAAVELCANWPDDAWLRKMATVFLLTESNDFAANGSRYLSQFLALASWCDGQLRAEGLQP